MRTNWWTLPPYTNVSNPSSPGGIFFLITRKIIDDMCGVCENGHGRTEFCYTDGCDKRRRRRSTNNKYQKNSLQSVVTNINEKYEISFPVQGNRLVLIVHLHDDVMWQLPECFALAKNSGRCGPQ